ncbi:hypothetical protein V5799_014884 [Amblyomma americanum]|uniref:Uncharacterized protein n=1 Tax=Amblyomma americanum TaxID=6943 RepID=A0AAQ4E1R1_AMBAM
MVASTFTYNDMYRHYQTYDIMVIITASKLTLETKQQRGSSNPPCVFLFTLNDIEFSEPILDYNSFHNIGLLMPKANKIFKAYVGDVITQGKYRKTVDDVVAQTKIPLPSDMKQKKNICSIVLNE